MVDTHCHVNLSPLDDQAATIVKEANNVGVDTLIIVGTDILSSLKAVELAKTHQQWATVGIHPELGALLELFSPANQKKMLSLWRSQLTKLAESPACVAIGECGLDYSSLQSDSTKAGSIRQLQAELFLMQAQLAMERSLPLTIHCRSTRGKELGCYDAYADVLELLTTLANQDHLPPFVLHCVSGPVDYVQACIALGGYVSFAGNVTYPSSHDIQALVKVVPADRLLLETDSPFLSPQGLRGRVNTPANVVQTAAYVATLLGMELDKLEQLTTANASTLFSI